jgi:hypothetical protein
MKQKIGFLFMIYDSIAHEETWNNFFKDVDPEKYVVLIHYKIQNSLTYFEGAKLKHCIPTEYGDISLVKAQNLLLTEALKDPAVYKMVLLSDTCIPLKSFNYVYDTLTKDNNGYFNECPKSQSFPRCEPVMKYIPRDEIYKSGQWFIANRTHASEYTTHDEYIKAFTVPYFDKDSSIHAEEHYYITINKKFCGTDDTIFTPNTAETATTFTNWQGMDYKYPSTRGIKNYTSVTKEEMEYLVSSPCLFGRKFLPYCRVDGIRMDKFLSNLI